MAKNQKYNMVIFRMEAVDWLTYEFSMTLVAFDKTFDYIKIKDSKSITIEFIGAIKFTYKFKIPQMFFWEFYGCCYYFPFTQICQLKDPLHSSLY
jgi:hypothetical protein